MIADNPSFRMIWGLYYEAGLAGLPGTFQFSLHQSWVLDTIKVAWLLAAFFVIVTYTPWQTCQVMLRVRDLKLKLDQSDVSKVTRV